MKTLLLLLLLFGLHNSFAQNQKIKQEKLSQFELQSSELILAPGESMVAKVSASNALLKGKTQQLLIKGWNIAEQHLKLK